MKRKSVYWAGGILLIVVIAWMLLTLPRIRETETIRHLIILYTNDEHGWMDSYVNSGGAAGMMRRWRREGLEPEGPFLLLSGGDMWTGPALSTSLRGESMIDVMNAMGYGAAAIGNHDFDFGLSVLRDRAQQAEFPFLSANIRDREDGSIPDFALPYVVKEINGIQVGVIGLTTRETRLDTKPKYVDGFEFVRYRDAVEMYAPKARADGAELLLIIGHICSVDREDLAPLAADLKIGIIAGGHCHEEFNEVINGVNLVESGYYLRGYIKIDLFFDTSTDEIIEMETTLIRNKAGSTDPEIEGLIENWRGELDDELLSVIGYNEHEIDRRTKAMDELILGSWLWAFPEADVAIASRRYTHQDIYPGEITPSTIVGVLATDNVIYEINLTGEELVATIEARNPMIAGVTEEDGDLFINGTPVRPDEVYRILIPDTLYAGGNYYKVYEYDDAPVDTGIDWREPIIRWIRSLNTTPQNPLNEILGVTQ